MAELMGNGERRAQAVVLDDAAAPVGVAHGSQLRKTFTKKNKTKIKSSISDTGDHTVDSFPNKDTHLRCRTCPSPCRCPACGQDTGHRYLASFLTALISVCFRGH